MRVDPALFAKYPWKGRSIEYHRAQVRRVYGTRGPTEDDEERWAQWLADEICPTETSRDRLAEAVVRRCRSEKVEPPTFGQVDRVVASGCRRFELLLLRGQPRGPRPQQAEPPGKPGTGSHSAFTRRSLVSDDRQSPSTITKKSSSARRYASLVTATW